MRDFAETVGRTLDFLGEREPFPFDRWFERATVRSHTAWADDLKDLHGSSIERWRQPEHAARVAELTSYPGALDLLHRLGYPLQ